MSDHVRPALPIKRKDIAMHLRADEGFGDSLSLPDFLMNQPGLGETPNPVKHRRTDATSPEAEPVSSLPSPPISSPTSFSAALYDEDVPLSASPALHRPTSPSNSISQMLSSHAAEHHEARNSPPSFASLSSPLSPQADGMMVDPPTPTFDSLVADAIRASKDRLQAHGGTPPPHPRHQHHSSNSQTSLFSSTSNHSRDSPHSSTSDDSVEKQLTQNMDMEEYEPNLKPSSPKKSRQLDPPTPSLAPNLMIEPISIPNRRQAWYAARPPRRSVAYKSEVRGSKNHRVSHSTPSQLYKQAVNASPAFHSGALQISPPTNGNGEMAYSSPSQPRSPTPSQSQTQGSSFEFGSYPPLQTQAPYQSQSFSP
ncbi:hypothetical protein H0H87_007926 [Tephrocybe sp. NHM501043]|nr:hypothetical protein H0H87_007926 [Tephrocybe sp. NHM501043]